MKLYAIYCCAERALNGVWEANNDVTEQEFQYKLAADAFAKYYAYAKLPPEEGWTDHVFYAARLD